MAWLVLSSSATRQNGHCSLNTVCLVQYQNTWNCSRKFLNREQLVLYNAKWVPWIYAIRSFLQLNRCVDYSDWLLSPKLFWFGDRRPRANVWPHAWGRNCITGRPGMENCWWFFIFGRPYYQSSLWYSMSSVCLSSVVCNVLYCGKTVRPSEKVSEGVNRKPGQKVHFLGRRHISTSGFAAMATATAVFALFLPVQPSNQY